MLYAQCSFLHFMPTLSEIPTEQILKQINDQVVHAHGETHGTY